MTTEQILVEILAIKLYEHSRRWPERRSSWGDVHEDNKETYRKLIVNATEPSDVYYKD